MTSSYNTPAYFWLTSLVAEPKLWALTIICFPEYIRAAWLQVFTADLRGLFQFFFDALPFFCYIGSEGYQSIFPNDFPPLPHRYVQNSSLQKKAILKNIFHKENNWLNNGSLVPITSLSLEVKFWGKNNLTGRTSNTWCCCHT